MLAKLGLVEDAKNFFKKKPVKTNKSKINGTTNVEPRRSSRLQDRK